MATKTKAELDERDHARGCSGGRVEVYTEQRPHTVGGGTVTVVRCVECGGQTIPEEA